MVRRVFGGRVQFHDGTDELAPGLSVHLIGGHTMGLQAVRVWTQRGWVVLASDASHLYANMEQERPFPVLYNLGDMLEGYRTLQKLASSRHSTSSQGTTRWSCSAIRHRSATRGHRSSLRRRRSNQRVKLPSD